MKPTLSLGLAVAVLWSCAAAARAQDASDAAAAPEDPHEAEFFERHIRPVLAEHCFACHGAAEQQSGLRLDSRSGLLAGGDSGPVVDLKDPPASRLLKALSYEDPDLKMPPAPAGKLPAAAIAALTTWIREGAYWPAVERPSAARSGDGATHWAFGPIRPQSIPQVRDDAWPLAPIDSFVLARLEAEGMTPSGGADRATLIRRATYDLIGLPPSEEETAAFVDDPSPGAFARLVDRLLESPHYGERWGRYWLDVARYAETKGYVRLQEERRFYCAFRYRDYVIRAFNEDLPYDRFIVEQLAADQLPSGNDRRPLAALGFLTLGRQFTGNKHDIIDDRIDVVSRGLLGLTVTCARCHDHKYDPIPTADYYSLYGVFASSEEPLVPSPIGNPPADAAGVAFEQEFARRWQALEDYEPKQYAALLNEFRARSADYLVKSLAGREPPQQPLPKAAGEIRQIVVERWIEYLERTGSDHPVFGPWHAFAALKPERFATEAATIVAHWTPPAGEPAAHIHAGVKRYFTAHPPQSMADVARGYGALLAEVHQRWQDLLASTAAAGSGALVRLSDAEEEELRQVLYGTDSPVAVRPQEAIGEYLYDSPINDEIVKRRNAIHQHLSQTAVAPPRAHTLVELPLAHEPRIFVRGNPTRPGRLVPRQFLQVLSPGDRGPFTVGGGRLELARAIVDRNNPLTARVAVNRVWAHHFGAGLVRSPSNFGLRGEMPTHPELLDYLALRFMDEGWSIKKLHRWIMLSRVYQQASRDRDDYRRRDPENRLLWRMNRRRLDFEALRDSLLVAAGRLDRTLGGPSVDLAVSTANRRSVYGLVDRQGLPGMLPTFDFASPDAHTPERYTTTVPQQALFLMNSPLAAELARSFAGRADVKSLENPAMRVARLIHLAWGRPVTERELTLALEFLARDQSASAPEGALDPWAALAQTLLLANEFSYVD
jgi:hypothetical protein